MMIQFGAPVQYWYHAVRYPVMLQNRTITTALNLKDTPYGLWHGVKPNLNHFHPFGCPAHRHLRKAKRNGKFEQASSPGVLIGRSDENCNYEVLDSETNKIHSSHNVTFQPMVLPLGTEDDATLNWDFYDEDVTLKQDKVLDEPANYDAVKFTELDEDDYFMNLARRKATLADQPKQLLESEENNDLPEEEVQVEEDPIPPIPEPEPRRSLRDRRPVDRYTPQGKACNKADNHHTECHEAMKSRAKPKSYRMAMKSKDAKVWPEACDKDMKNNMDIGVWEIVDLPKNSLVVGGRWHFKLKLNPNGSINKHKARYFAKGYTQTEGVDSTFSAWILF